MSNINHNLTIDSKVEYDYKPCQPGNMPPLKGSIHFYYKNQEIIIPETRSHDNLEIKIVCDRMILLEKDEKTIFTTNEPEEVQLRLYNAKRRFERELYHDFLYGLI